MMSRCFVDEIFRGVSDESVCIGLEPKSVYVSTS